MEPYERRAGCVEPIGPTDWQRRTYAPPRLTVRGDVRGLTMGGSPGLNDSGPVQPTQPPV